MKDGNMIENNISVEEFTKDLLPTSEREKSTQRVVCSKKAYFTN